MDSEPVVTVAVITATATTLVGLLVVFGLPLTAEQQAGILGLVAVLAPFVVTYARRWAWSPASHRKAIAAAVAVPNRITNKPRAEPWSEAGYPAHRQDGHHR